MLNAIARNKYVKTVNGEYHEDSLTSSVFERLFYLPNDMLWTTINNASYGNISLEYGKIQKVSFWESLYLPSGERREPDILVFTDKFNLLIEAKRYDNNQQKKTQWDEQIRAYLNSYEEYKEKPLFLLAVGGISDEYSEKMEYDGKTVMVIKCRWRKLLYEIKRLEHLLEKSKTILSNIDANLVILSDIILAFSLQGYSTGEWFELMSNKIKINPKSHKSFLNYTFNQ